MKDVTMLLHEIEEGDPAAADELLPLVYDELYAKEWEQIISQPVTEKALFFTETNEYVPL